MQSGSSSGGSTHFADLVRSSTEAQRTYNPQRIAAEREALRNPEEPADETAARLLRESLSERDPLGGMWHREIYRDPAAGFVPQHAPRNFADGGQIDYPHHLDPTASSLAFLHRESLEHSTQKRKVRNKKERRSLRQKNATDRERDQLDMGRDLMADAARAKAVPKDPSPQVAFQTIFTAKTQRNLLGNWINGDTQQTAPKKELAELPAGDLERHQSSQRESRVRLEDDELMYKIHGLRDREKHVADRSVFFSIREFRGYDLDKWISQSGNRLSTPALVAPGSMTEAQKTLRENTIPSDQAVAAKVLSRNTVAAQPKLGEALVEAVTSTLDAVRTEGENAADAAYRAAMGIGRKTPLVNDEGPDVREQKLHQNDERLLHAAKVYGHELQPQRGLNSDPDVYRRHKTDHGVDVFMRGSFDIDRRQALLTRGKRDPTESNTIHYGIPIKQQVDNMVRTKKGERGERPMAYFMQDPTDRQLRLNAMRRDLEGFPLFKRRPEFLEWELFVRYRAHHFQRRALALKHGLEPRRNETVDERNARREALDALCERTAFDESAIRTAPGDVRGATSAVLRQIFGEYLLPSVMTVRKVVGAETLIGLDLAPPLLPEDPAEGGQRRTDDSEPLMSARYFNRLLTLDGYNSRVQRGVVKETSGRVPEPIVPHRQPSNVLRYFSERELRIYADYMKLTVDQVKSLWESAYRERRWVAEVGCWGSVLDATSHRKRVEDVVDVQKADGQVLTVPYSLVQTAMRAQERSSDPILIDQSPCTIVEGSRRGITLVKVTLDNGATTTMEESVWSALPVEVDFSVSTGVDPNANLNPTAFRYSYNRSNYIETQDYLWEQGTYHGVEGWSPAHHTDVTPGAVVRCRPRVRGTSGELARAVVVKYETDPLLNPQPRRIAVAFVAAPQTVEEVLLEDTLVWQCDWSGPQRSKPEETERFSAGLRRYVDYANPENKKPAPHFLDKYADYSEKAAMEYRSVRQITALDQWKNIDIARGENHRLLSMRHRGRDFPHRYYYALTPWDYIAHQEADQPMIAEELRRPHDTPPAFFFLHNRFWLTKARPHGYLYNFPNETRDLLRYVDAVTPWSKAKNIRSHYEIREHNPMPVWNRHYVGLHRNNLALLPMHLLDIDKKTGKVRAVKESVATYNVADTEPAWSVL